MAYDGAGDYAKSEQCFVQAEKEGAGHPLALVGRAFRLLHTRQLKDARTAVDEALRKAPHFWETQFAAGYVLDELAHLGIVPPSRAGARPSRCSAKRWSCRRGRPKSMAWLAAHLLHTPSAENRAEGLRLFDQSIALEPRNGNRYINRAMMPAEQRRPQGRRGQPEEGPRAGGRPRLDPECPDAASLRARQPGRSFSPAGRACPGTAGLASQRRQLVHPWLQLASRFRGAAPLRGAVQAEPGIHGSVCPASAAQGTGQGLHGRGGRGPCRPESRSIQPQAAEPGPGAASVIQSELEGPPSAPPTPPWRLARATTCRSS